MSPHPPSENQASAAFLDWSTVEKRKLSLKKFTIAVKNNTTQAMNVVMSSGMRRGTCKGRLWLSVSKGNTEKQHRRGKQHVWEWRDGIRTCHVLLAWGGVLLGSVRV